MIYHRNLILNIFYDYPYKSAGIVRFIGHLLWYNRHEQSEKGMKVHVETKMQAD